MKLAMLLLIFPASFCILAEPCPPQAKLLEMRMQSNRMQLNHAILKHPEDYSAACIKKAAEDLAELERDWLTAKDWSSPAPEFTLPHLSSAPVIDGKADEPVWRQARKWLGSFPCSSEKYLADGSIWRLAWHGRYLYGSVFFPDCDMTFYKGRQGESWENRRIWQGDCLEVFVQPDESIPYYLEFLLSPGNTAWILDHALPESGFWTTIHFHFQYEIQVAGHINDNGYELEFRIDLADFPPYQQRRKPRGGDVLRMTMVRMNLDIRKQEKTVQTSFYPLLHSGHNIFGYAKMILAEGKSLKNH